jgi:hypothetical protein
MKRHGEISLNEYRESVVNGQWRLFGISVATPEVVVVEAQAQAAAPPPPSPPAPKGKSTAAPK